MAGPHVAGTVALLVSAAPCLAGDVDGIEAYLKQTAVPRTDNQTCGGFPGSQVPNPVYGYGALRAVLPSASLCGIFSDGFESGDTNSWSAAVPSGSVDVGFLQAHPSALWARKARISACWSSSLMRVKTFSPSRRRVSGRSKGSRSYILPPGK